MPPFRRFVPPLAAVLLLAGCLASPPLTPPSLQICPSAQECPPPPVQAPDGEILDLLLLPQDIGAYLGSNASTRDLPLWPDQGERSADYLLHHFAPWEKVSPPATKGAAYWILGWLKGKKVFDYTGRALPEAKIREAVARADADRYPSLDRPAITVRATVSRALPERRPWFLNPALPGEGLPFDYLQNSALPAHTPVRVRHRSLDGAWVFAETAAVPGWLPAEDVAFVDESFIRRFRETPQVTAIDGPLPVADVGGTFRFQAGLGTLFPLVEARSDGWRVLIAVADADGRALLREAILPAAPTSRFPLPATARNLVSLGNRLLGQPYGWGGLYGDRDCSATLRDLFAPFGLWLPRNSGQQAEAGTRIFLAGLAAAEKEAVILASGLPLRTILWMKGHVLLYIGEYFGRPVALHTLWGIRIRDGQGKDGRKVVGRTVITTLQPGVERDDFAVPEGDLLARIGSMTILGSRLTPEELVLPVRP